MSAPSMEDWRRHLYLQDRCQHHLLPSSQPCRPLAKGRGPLAKNLEEQHGVEFEDTDWPVSSVDTQEH